MSSSVSFRDVARIGAEAVKAAGEPAPLRPGCGISLPLRVETRPDGRHYLVNTKTGAVWGLLASPEVGNRTGQFFT